MQPFSASVEERAPRCYAVTLTGEIDLSVTGRLEAALAPMIVPDVLVAIDLSQVTFMDSSGLHLLNRLSKLAKLAGARFWLCAPSTEVRRVFELVGADYFLEILDDMQSAFTEN